MYTNLASSLDSFTWTTELFSSTLCSAAQLTQVMNTFHTLWECVVKVMNVQLWHIIWLCMYSCTHLRVGLAGEASDPLLFCMKKKENISGTLECMKKWLVKVVKHTCSHNHLCQTHIMYMLTFIWVTLLLSDQFFSLFLVCNICWISTAVCWTPCSLAGLVCGAADIHTHSKHEKSPSYIYHNQSQTIPVCMPAQTNLCEPLIVNLETYIHTCTHVLTTLYQLSMLATHTNYTSASQASQTMNQIWSW